MPTFTGTSREFKRYIGPRLRNLVQMLTKKHKAAIAACEHCGADKNLEAAHVQGRDRNQIIDILLLTGSSDQVVTVDLQQFEAQFQSEHEPLEKAILILCRQCHATYDAQDTSPLKTRIKPSDPDCPSSAKPAEGLLPITLDPPQPAAFKSSLLTHKHAEILIYYQDDRIERRPWDASKFTDTSSVMGNLRSRPEFRQGAWQAAGILKVHVCVKRIDA